MKIHSMGADGRTDATKLIVALRNVAKAPENEELLLDTFYVEWFRNNKK
jgi:hypothetical protein